MALSISPLLYSSPTIMSAPSASDPTAGDRIASVDATLSSVIGQLETEANLKKVRRSFPSPSHSLSPRGSIYYLYENALIF